MSDSEKLLVYYAMLLYLLRDDDGVYPPRNRGSPFSSERLNFKSKVVPFSIVMLRLMLIYLNLSVT